MLSFKFFTHFGRYLYLLKNCFVNPDKPSIYWKEVMRQCVEIGVGSLLIVIIFSVFLGAVLTVQTAFQFTSPLLSRSIIGSIVTNTAIIEMAPSVTCLILAGKIGSSIASELGTMRITEQIDALEMMGVNSAAYLVLPKVLAATIMIPVLVMIAGFLQIFMGLTVGVWSNVLTNEEFMQGSIQFFIPFTINFAIIKATTFGFLMSSISAYLGYYTSGGALEVGRSATRAVVTSCIFILIFDYILAEILL
ncbi:MAG TPA: ABC transporter permease [Chitinophagales bacterium]|nr:ABC transporter permease [Chitinophagales bacterium]